MRRALALATATAGALEGIHRAGSVHGGVTPDAVLISREGWSKLTTLRGGQAPATDPEDARHIAGYCSPEVLRGGPVDASADVWALGVTLNLVTMFGLLIVVGMLADDAIVVADIIIQRSEKGEKPEDAAIAAAPPVAGNERIAGTGITATLLGKRGRGFG